MKSLEYIFLASILCLGGSNGQTTDWQLDSIKRELNNANASLSEINKREEKRNRDQQDITEAQQEAKDYNLRLLPLDKDLGEILKDQLAVINRNSYNLLYKSNMIKSSHLHVARIQEARNNDRNQERLVDEARAAEQAKIEAQSAKAEDPFASPIPSMLDISGLWQFPKGTIFDGRKFGISKAGSFIKENGQEALNGIEIKISAKREINIVISVPESDQEPSYKDVFQWDSFNELLVFQGVRLKKIGEAK